MSIAWPGVVTEVIFIKCLWEENSLFLYKVVNFFKILRRNITGDFMDRPVLLWTAFLIEVTASKLLSKALDHTGLAQREFYFNFLNIGGVATCGPAFSHNYRWCFSWFWNFLTGLPLALVFCMFFVKNVVG